MPKKMDMIFVGKKKMQELVNELGRHTGMTKKEIAEAISLSREGLFHITNRSGKINSINWELFKKLYKKELKESIEIDESDNRASLLADYSLEELIAEIKKRGGNVTF